MQVTINVTRSDIAWLNVSKLFCLKSNLRVFLFVLVVAAFFAWRGAVDDGGQFDWMVVALATVIGAVAGFSVIFLFSLIFVLLSSNAKSGVIGEHIYTIEDAGLREVTEANDTLVFWPSIQKVEKSNRSILIQINPWLFHVLPYRAFESAEQFDLFHSLVEKHYNEHSTDS